MDGQTQSSRGPPPSGCEAVGVPHIRVLPALSPLEEGELSITNWALNRTTPTVVFNGLVLIEMNRLEHQVMNRSRGRPQTYPVDPTISYKANAENNIRARWIEQGIWDQSWGPAVPSNTGNEMSGSRTLPRPFDREESQNTRKFSWGLRWGHEERVTDCLIVTEEQARFQPDDFSHLRYPDAAPDVSTPRIPGPKPVSYSKKTRLYSYPDPRPNVLDPEASRPYHQFSCQLIHERQWVRDEIAWKGASGSHVSSADIESIAQRNLKSHWIQAGVWDERWGHEPGLRWRHEDHAEHEALLDAEALQIRPCHV